MKRICFRVVCMLLILALLPLGAMAASKQVVRVTHYQKVNVRSGPSTGYRTLGEVSPGEVFDYLGTQNGWNCIQYTSSQIGYVSAKLTTVETQYVSDASSGATSSSGSAHASAGSFVTITHYQKVNVRYGPSSSYSYIREVSPRDEFPYLGTLNGWHCIEMEDGKLGYVYGKYASVTGATFEAPGIVCTRCGGDGWCPKCFMGEVYSTSSGRWKTCLTCGGTGDCTACRSSGFAD